MRVIYFLEGRELQTNGRQWLRCSERLIYEGNLNSEIWVAEQSEGNARHKTFTNSYQYECPGGLAQARESREREVLMSIPGYEIQGTNMDTPSDRHISLRQGEGRGCPGGRLLKLFWEGRARIPKPLSPLSGLNKQKQSLPRHFTWEQEETTRMFLFTRMGCLSPQSHHYCVIAVQVFTDGTGPRDVVVNWKVLPLN